MPRTKSAAFRQHQAELRAILVERFPLCFSPKGAPKRPLKIGIHDDIVARCPDLAVKDVRTALADYTQGPTYRAAFLLGTLRIDLDGNAVAQVSAKDAEHAGKKLMEMGRVEAALSIARSLSQDESVAA